MVRSRTATAALGVLLSLAISVAAWWYFNTLLLFLFVPFVPLVLRSRGPGSATHGQGKRCPACGFRTDDPTFEYCPRDGRRLEPVE